LYLFLRRIFSNKDKPRRLFYKPRSFSCKCTRCYFVWNISLYDILISTYFQISCLLLKTAKMFTFFSTHATKTLFVIKHISSIRTSTHWIWVTC